MSTERTLEDVWFDQMAMAKRRTQEAPREFDPATEADLRVIMGDEIVDRIRAEEAGR